MKFLQTIFLFVLAVCLGQAIRIYTAEEKVAAAQVTALNAEEQETLKRYISMYNRFKQAVLNNNLQMAISELPFLQTVYNQLPYNLQTKLYAHIPDDQITYRLGVKPSEPTFFLQAYALIDRMDHDKEPAFISSEKFEQQMPTPPFFISSPKKITDEFSIAPDKFIVYHQNDLTSALNNRSPSNLYFLASRPDLIKDNLRLILQDTLTRLDYAPVEYLLQKVPQLLNPNDILHSIITSNNRSSMMPMLSLLHKYGVKFNNISDKINDKDLLYFFIYAGKSAESIQALLNILGKENVVKMLHVEPSLFLRMDIMNNPALVKFLLDENFNVDVRSKVITSPIQVLVSGVGENGALSLQYILESPQLTNNPELKDRLINAPNAQGLKPLCRAAEAKLTEVAKLLIKHGADCADEKYKDFLVPLIKEVEKGRAAEAESVLRQNLPETQSSLHPLPGIVKEYIAGEKERSRPSTPVEESTPSTGPATEVD